MRLSAVSFFLRMRSWSSKDRWVAAALLLLAFAVRWVAIEMKPPHFDEGINGWFADRMCENGFFAYDPENYHGPLYFYAVFLGQMLFGRELWVLRLPAVLAGVASVGVLLAFGRYYGKNVARFAALALALSPAYVFYSRYSIHESWLVFFNLLFFLGVVRLWEEGDKTGLRLAVAGFFGMVLVKETYIIQSASLAMAWGCLWVWGKVIPAEGSLGWAKRSWSWDDFLGAVLLGVFAVVFFYSGTFYNPAGLHGLWQTVVAWVQTGTQTGGHEKEAFDLFGTPLNWYWVSLFLRYEWLGVAGLAGCFFCLGKVAAPLRLAAIYGGGLLLAYSLVPYKTPWCILSFLWPFFLVFAGVIFTVSGKVRVVLSCVYFCCLAWGTVTMARLNFWDYDNEKEPYVYVQTYREIRKVTEPLLAAAKNDARNYGLRGEILTESYYPLPWILGDFYNIGYFGGVEWPAVLSGDFVIGDEAKREEIRGRLKGEYEEEVFRIRDAQEPSVVFFKKGVFHLNP